MDFSIFHGRRQFFLKIIVKNKNLLAFFYVFIIAFKEHLNNQNGFVLLFGRLNFPPFKIVQWFVGGGGVRLCGAAFKVGACEQFRQNACGNKL